MAIILFAFMKYSVRYSFIGFDVIQVLYIFYLVIVRPFNLPLMIMNMLSELGILVFLLYITI